MKVRDVIGQLEADGGYLHETRGSHRQFKHPRRPGRVTVPAEPNDDLAEGTLASIRGQGWLARKAMKRYAVVIENAGRNYSAYVPDLPGCVATGRTLDEVECEIREAIQFHIEGLREDGLPVPEPTTTLEYVEV